ncbi:hypothetical protein EPN87_02195 [archaeon]|nr:MAG: hypothetical protein EPN87_02195 [archaeon]
MSYQLKYPNLAALYEAVQTSRKIPLSTLLGAAREYKVARMEVVSSVADVIVADKVLKAIVNR